MNRVKSHIFIVVLLLLSVVCACKNVPSHVIKPDKMASLMADIRMADAVISIQRKDYPSEEERLALKDAVFARHNVSSEQFDTSLIWYGHNMGMYQDITKETLSILEERLKETNRLSADEAAMSVAGDTVDIWDSPTVAVITSRSPSQFIVFGFDEDPNWEQGDVYTLTTHLVTPAKYGQWNLTAFYDDGALETISSNIELDKPGKQELTLITDSTRHAVRLSGWINIEPNEWRPAILDSIGLTRRRTSPELARTRKYSQKQYLPRTDESDTEARQKISLQKVAN